jgi:hypothetical protein
MASAANALPKLPLFLASILGYVALIDFVHSIPRSNDDFSLF